MDGLDQLFAEARARMPRPLYPLSRTYRQMLLVPVEHRVEGVYSFAIADEYLSLTHHGDRFPCLEVALAAGQEAVDRIPIEDQLYEVLGDR